MEHPELVVADGAAWRAWLEDHHEASPGVWLVLAKKGVTEPTALTYDQALEEAICFGWIDGQLQRRDTTTFCRRFTPRGARSAWSQRNVALAQRLAASGQMRRAGQAEVEKAQEDGRWERAYDGQAQMDVPDDFRRALNANARAHAMFETLTRSNRYAVLYRIADAKRAETRAKRIAQYVDMLARGETLHPQKHTRPDAGQ